MYSYERDYGSMHDWYDEKEEVYLKGFEDFEKESKKKEFIGQKNSEEDDDLPF